MKTETVSSSSFYIIGLVVLFGCSHDVVESQFQPPVLGLGTQPATIRQFLQQQSLTVQINLMIRFSYGYILDDISSWSTVLALPNAVLQAKIDQMGNNNSRIQEFVSSLIISQYMTVRNLVQATLNNVTVLTLANTQVIAQNYSTSTTINGGIVLLEQIVGNGIVIVLSDIFAITRGNILSNLQSLSGNGIGGVGGGILNQLIRAILSLPILRDLFGSANGALTFIVPPVQNLIQTLLNPSRLLNSVFNRILFPSDLMLSNSVTSLANGVLPVSIDGLNRIQIGPDTCVDSGPAASTTGGLIYFAVACSTPRGTNGLLPNLQDPTCAIPLLR